MNIFVRDKNFLYSWNGIFISCKMLITYWNLIKFLSKNYNPSVFIDVCEFGISDYI